MLVVAEGGNRLLGLQRMCFGGKPLPGDLHLARSAGEDVPVPLGFGAETRHHNRLARIRMPGEHLENAPVEPARRAATVGEEEESMAEQPAAPHPVQRDRRAENPL